MQQNKGFLRLKEILAMTLILVGMKLADSTPALMAQKAQNGFWMIPLISFICIFPSFLLLLYLLKKYQDKNILGVIEAITGKWIGKMIGFVLFLSAFLTLTLDSRNYVEQIKLLYFPESPTDIIFLIFMGVVFFGAKKGFEVIGYTSWMTLFIIKTSTFIVLMLMFGDLIIQRLFPIFGSGFTVILSEGVKKAAIFSELFFLLIAYQSAKRTSMFRKGIVIGSVISIIEITIFYMAYATIFDYNSIDKIHFPYHDITQLINLGDFLTNIETVFMVFWLLAAFLRFIIFIYISTWIFGEVFEIRNFEPLLLPFSFLAILIGLLPINSIINELIFHHTLIKYMTPFLIFLPVVLWIIAWSKGDLKK
ncbi:GerAB/ArcD/ProY family transporter [Gracilibacillus sp. HCP3S3_G5_1]|uniref:GerAB/ArcD/ProY family transporter n=1 Tax=unclassified Gracilibacillus TaxID=2625209 RepID=UPI003F89AAC1